jgi:protein SCO1/2
VFAALTLLAACGGNDATQTAAATDQAAHDATAALDHSARVEHPATAEAQHAQEAHAEHPVAAAPHDHATESLPTTPLAELSGSSLYHLSSAWTNQHQERVALPDLAGGPAVVVMFYGDCTTACPLLVKTAEDIEAALSEELREITRFVMVSFDTERDTPAKLLEYAASKGLDRDGWHWLVGSPLQTRQLATVLGVQFRDAGNGVFAHSNVVSVLDAGGVPVARLEGLGGDLGAAVDAITAAAGG